MKTDPETTATYPLLVVLLLGLLLLFNPAQAQLTNTAGIDAYLNERVESTKIPGLVALVVNAQGEIYSAAVGRRDVAGDVPMTMDTIFRIASMTKPISASAVMMLVENGQLGLDDAIADYIPAYADPKVVVGFDPTTSEYSTRPAHGEISIRHLLSHSSGLAYGFASEVRTSIRKTNPDAEPRTLPLLYDPGTRWSYSRGISEAAVALEHITGVGLDRFLHERLFGPLGMTETTFIVPRNNRHRVATRHRMEDGALVEGPNPADVRSAVSADGGLHSTARDYAKFIQMILNEGVTADGKRLLSRDSIREMSRSQLDGFQVSLQDAPSPGVSKPFPLGANRDGFGLGLQVTGVHNASDQRAPGSLSWAGILNTQFWIDPANGIGGILLMQYLPFYDEDAIETLTSFESLVYASLQGK